MPKLKFNTLSVVAITLIMFASGCSLDKAAPPTQTNADSNTKGSATLTSTGTKDSAKTPSAKNLASVAIPTFPAGEPSGIVIVAQASKLDRSGSIPIVVRNNTGGTVNRIKVSGTIRDSQGALVASGSDQQFLPNVVAAGEVAIGYVYIGFGTNLPKEWKAEFQTSATPINKSRFENIRDLEVVEFNRVDKRIIGSLVNLHPESVNGPIGVRLMCFDKSGTPTGVFNDFAEPDKLAQNAKTSFQIELYGDTCSSFIFGGSGFAEM